MASQTPLALAKEKFGDKAKLVKEVEKLATDDLWVSRTNKNKGLAHVSNAKLLRLHATFSEVKEKFGTREKLIDAVLELQKRGKDSGLRQQLASWPVPRLYDSYKSLAKRLGGAKPAPTAKAAVPKAPPKAAPRSAAAPKAAKTAAAAKPAKKTATKAAKATPAKAKKG